MAEIIITGGVQDINRINRYSSVDTNLVESSKISSKFDINNDYIEYHVIDNISNILLDSNYFYTGYKIPFDASLNPDGTYPFVEINPFNDIKNLYSTGEFRIIYNIFRNNWM